MPDGADDGSTLPTAVDWLSSSLREAVHARAGRDRIVDLIFLQPDGVRNPLLARRLAGEHRPRVMVREHGCISDPDAGLGLVDEGYRLGFANDAAHIYCRGEDEALIQRHAPGLTDRGRQQYPTCDTRARSPHTGDPPSGGGMAADRDVGDASRDPGRGRWRDPAVPGGGDGASDPDVGRQGHRASVGRWFRATRLIDFRAPKPQEVTTRTSTIANDGDCSTNIRKDSSP